MNTLDRYEYRDKYNESPSRIEHCPVGKSIKINGTILKVLSVEKKKDNGKVMTLADGDEEFILDLSPHWERGPEGPIKTCHDGVVNLIKGIYAQTESDYEKLYLAGEKGYYMERIPGESVKEYEGRRKSLYRELMKNCEEFLGSVFTEYAKIRALWSISHDVNYIAEVIKSTPYHVSCVVDRLGLNRTQTVQDDDDLY